MTRLRTWALPAAIVLAGWSVLLLYAYPGVMTQDSVDQLKEGRAWFFTDCHPPAMAALWGLIDRVIPGPLGMLVLQTAAFTLGLFLLLRRAMKPTRAAVCTAFLLLFPPVLAPLAVIWKDCMMAGFLLLGIAGVLAARRRFQLAGLAALVVATAMRYPALAATLPIIVLLFEWKRGQHWLVRYALALGVWLAVSGIALGANALLTDRKMSLWYSSIALQDIVGTLRFVDGDIPDSELEPVLRPTQILAGSNLHATIRARYDSADFLQLVRGEQRLWDVNIDGSVPTPAPQSAAIGRAWRTILGGHPGAFVRYRLESFGETLGVNPRFMGLTIVRHRGQSRALLASVGLSPRSSPFAETVEDVLLWFKRTRLFRPHSYALLALALLGFCRGRRDVFALLSSGLVLELSMLPLCPTPDYRYSHWLITCTCLGLVLLVAHRAKRPEYPGGIAV